MKKNLSIKVDIEDWYCIPSLRGSLFSAFKDVNEFFKTWNSKDDYLIEPTKRALDYLDKYNAVTKYMKIRKSIRMAPRCTLIQGFEIGNHCLIETGSVVKGGVIKNKFCGVVMNANNC